LRPLRVILDHVENDVGVDQDQAGLSARERHDFAGGHLDRCRSTQLGKAALRGLRPAHGHENRFALWAQLEFDSAAGADTQSVAYSFGNRDLPFARDLAAHASSEK
jgi:hypothetical protein